jgi:hypothetical protein
MTSVVEESLRYTALEFPGNTLFSVTNKKCQLSVAHVVSAVV